MKALGFDGAACATRAPGWRKSSGGRSSASPAAKSKLRLLQSLESLLLGITGKHFSGARWRRFGIRRPFCRRRTSSCWNARDRAAGKGRGETPGGCAGIVRALILQRAAQPLFRGALAAGLLVLAARQKALSSAIAPTKVSPVMPNASRGRMPASHRHRQAGHQCSPEEKCAAVDLFFRRGSGDREPFDQLLDLVDEIGRAGAVHDAVIEGQRKRDHFHGLRFFPLGESSCGRSRRKACRPTAARRSGAAARTPKAPRLLMTSGAFIASTRPPRVASTVSL